MPWQCPICTFSNDNARSVCEMCQTPKPAAAPVAVPVANRSAASVAAGPKEDDVAFLVSMGFDRPRALRALQAKPNREDALSWLLENMDEPAAPVAAPVAPKPAPAQQSKPAAAAPGSQPAVAPAPAKPASTAQPVQPAKPAATPQSEAKKPAPAPTTAAITKPLAEMKLDPEAAKRQAERERLAKQLEEQQQAALAASKAAAAQQDRKQQVAELLKQKKREEEEKRLRDAIERQKHLDDANAAGKEDIGKKRQMIEAGLKDIPSAIAHVEKDYGVARCQELCKMLATIVGNILAQPNEPKYRRINVSKQQYQYAIGRPYGGPVIMQKLGFVQDKDDANVIVLPKPDLKLLQTTVALVKQRLKQLSTSVPDLMNEALNSKVVSLEGLYYAAIELRNQFGNVLTAATDDIGDTRNFRQVDTSSPVYAKFFKPIPQIGQILKDFGFVADEAGVFLTVDKPDRSKFETAGRELNQLIEQLASQTPIRIAVKTLVAKNKWEIVEKFVQLLQPALQKIVNTPTETKYHKIKLQPFFDLVGGLVDGGREFFKLFGFQVDAVQNAAVMPYPEANGFDLDLLKRRLTDFVRSWQEEQAIHSSAANAVPEQPRATPAPKPQSATPAPVVSAAVATKHRPAPTVSQTVTSQTTVPAAKTTAPATTAPATRASGARPPATDGLAQRPVASATPAPKAPAPAAGDPKKPGQR